MKRISTNKKAFTLIELVVYIVILMVISTTVVSLFYSLTGTNKKQTLAVEKIQNISKAEKYLSKVTENINNVLLLKHIKQGEHLFTYDSYTINNKYYNQHNFTLGELKTNCSFIIDGTYDIAAFTTRDGLDPIVIGVIEKKDTSNRIYRQLSVYKYYSLFYQKDYINQDVISGKINDYIGTNGSYKTQGLTAYKCNIDNGFLIPISSKYYIDEIGDYDYTFFLKGLKIKIFGKTAFKDYIKKYKNGLLNIELNWEERYGDRSIGTYQLFSKNFKY